MKNNRTYFFPEAFRSFCKTRSFEALGLCALFCAIFLWLSFLSYDATDPSWNTISTVEGYSNLFEGAGAYTTDILFQYLGKACYLVPIVLTSWGLRFLFHRQVTRPIKRLSSLLGAIITCSLLFSFLANTFNTPVMGSVPNLLVQKALAVFKNIDFLVGPYSGIGIILSGVLFLMTLGFFLFSLGMSRLEWQVLIQGFYRILSAGGRGLWWAYRRWKAYADLKPKAQIESYGDEQLSTQADEAQDLPLVLTKSYHDNTKAPVSPHLTHAKQKKQRPYVPAPMALRDVNGYTLPSLDLLQPSDQGKSQQSSIRKGDLDDNIDRLDQVLQDYGIKGKIVGARPGPVVTLYELEPAPGIKSSRVIGLADDIARSMSAIAARIAVVPGKNLIGIELPNPSRQTVFLKELLEYPDFENTQSKLTISLGKNIAGVPVYADLARMPHMIVAGTTGSGKSVAVNAMILSLLYRHSPETCRLLLIDPKMLEFSMYNDIPHLLTPVVTDPKKAIFALKWAVREMEDRYKAMSYLGVRNIENYNNTLKKALAEGRELKRTVQTGFDPDTGNPIYEDQVIGKKTLPYIVIVVDEMADLMMVAGKDIEAAVQRLAQMARAAGIHVIMATQRPSVDVITGTIKANFPTRISFQVTSRFDSRTILGDQGAEQLLGRGDMLFMEAGGKIQRVHGPFVSDEEVDRVVQFLKNQGNVEYIDSITDESSDLSLTLAGDDDNLGDDLYRQAVQIVKMERKASTSYVQRRLQIGYNRAARIIEQMEAEGIISPANHVGKREILIEKAG